jgi:hypothetical protein
MRKSRELEYREFLWKLCAYLVIEFIILVRKKLEVLNYAAALLILLRT